MEDKKEEGQELSSKNRYLYRARTVVITVGFEENIEYKDNSGRISVCQAQSASPYCVEIIAWRTYTNQLYLKAEYLEQPLNY